MTEQYLAEPILQACHFIYQQSINHCISALNTKQQRRHVNQKISQSTTWEHLDDASKCVSFAWFKHHWSRCGVRILPLMYLYNQPWAARMQNSACQPTQQTVNQTNNQSVNQSSSQSNSQSIGQSVILHSIIQSSEFSSNTYHSLSRPRSSL
jgi:hypothetical protein